MRPSRKRCLVGVLLLAALAGYLPPAKGWIEDFFASRYSEDLYFVGDAEVDVVFVVLDKEGQRAVKGALLLIQGSRWDGDLVYYEVFRATADESGKAKWPNRFSTSWTENSFSKLKKDFAIRFPRSWNNWELIVTAPGYIDEQKRLGNHAVEESVQKEHVTATIEIKLKRVKANRQGD
jgi:hypothetical protein